jgi:hypothetical protein
MKKIELTNDESTALVDILDSYLSDLRMEVADTDSKDLRDDLKAREQFITVLLSKLQ